MPHLSSLQTHARTFLIGLLSLAVAPLAAVAEYALSPEEAVIASHMVNDPDQQRPAMQLDPILSQVARERAQDMAARDYFSHTNPDGFAANYLVWSAGYDLPAWWGNGAADNFIESIAGGYSSPDDTWLDWMDSPGHRTHILALEPFYQNQTSYGVGYAYSATSIYKHYWVILTAPPSTPEPNAALFLSQGAPAAMTAGQTYSVSVSVLNSGSETWTQAGGYRLVSNTPGVNWGASNVPLPGDVAPGSEVIFSFSVTAPATAGSHAFQWRMEQQGAGLFGETSANYVIAVTAPVIVPPVSAPPPVSYSYSPSPSSYSAPSSSSKSSKKKEKKKKKKKKKKK